MTTSLAGFLLAMVYGVCGGRSKPWRMVKTCSHANTHSKPWRTAKACSQARVHLSLYRRWTYTVAFDIFHQLPSFNSLTTGFSPGSWFGIGTLNPSRSAHSQRSSVTHSQSPIPTLPKRCRLMTSPPHAWLFERFRYRCAAADWMISELPKGKCRQVRVPFFGN